jgi:mRNA-degrading endonuclease RelE of RelBE toxin-antitoxin system
MIATMSNRPAKHKLTTVFSISNREVKSMKQKEAYVIEFSDTAFKHFRRYPKHVRRRIMWRLRQLAADPYAKSNVKHVYISKCPYRLRVGKYRVLYRLDEQIRLIDILPRKKVYSKYRVGESRRTA